MNSFQALRKALGLDVARQSEALVRTSDTACSRRGFGNSAWPSRDQGTGTRGCSSNAWLGNPFGSRRPRHRLSVAAFTRIVGKGIAGTADY